jgi:hypothetical protein
MSATTAVPGVSGFLQAYADAIRGERGQRHNVRRGSTLDLVGGSGAMAWARLSARDRDLFRANLTDGAQGADLDRQVLRRYGVARIRDSFGAGMAVFERPTTLAGADTLDAGTRIRVIGPGISEVYRIATTTVVGPLDTTISVPIEATRPGPGVALSVAGAAIAIDDSVFDASLAVVSLTCADGTLEESPAAYVARARAVKKSSRIGYRAAVIKACKAAGAAVVVVLAPDAYGPELDQALINVYVADAGYSTSTALVDACYVALEAVRVAGCDLQVLGMTMVPVALAVEVQLWADPSKFDQIGLKRDIIDALVGAFEARADFWLFSTDSLAGDVYRATGQSAQLATLSATPPAPAATFPAVLPRYTLASSAITLSLVGP